MRSKPPVDLSPLSRLFRALGDENRLRIVALLSRGELCVCHFQEALGLSQPNASRHLSVLRAAGLVTVRREGNWIHYRLAKQSDPACERQIRLLARSFAKKSVSRLDLKRLVKSRGPAACP